MIGYFVNLTFGFTKHTILHCLIIKYSSQNRVNGTWVTNFLQRHKILKWKISKNHKRCVKGLHNFSTKRKERIKFSDLICFIIVVTTRLW